MSPSTRHNTGEYPTRCDYFINAEMRHGNMVSPQRSSRVDLGPGFYHENKPLSPRPLSPNPKETGMYTSKTKRFTESNSRIEHGMLVQQCEKGPELGPGAYYSAESTASSWIKPSYNTRIRQNTRPTRVYEGSKSPDQFDDQSFVSSSSCAR